MKLKVIFLLMLSVMMASCSSEEDAKSKQFVFLEFEKDVIVPFANTGDITFLAYDFDTNLGHWDIKVTDQNGIALPAVLDRVEDTGIGYSERKIQRIAFKAAPKEEGTYTLVITNKTTGQLYTDHFLVRSKTFNKIQYPVAESYNIISSYIVGTPEPTQDYIYFHNVKNTIISDVTSTGIFGIRLQDVVNASKEYNIAYTVNAGKIEFILPVGVSPGKYYLSVQYNNQTRAYFEKDILVQAEKIPTIASINKNTFKGGETMILKGVNFRYKVSIETLPELNYRNYKAESWLVFTDNKGTGEMQLSGYELGTGFKFMNAEATEINFPIPGNTSRDDFFYVTDAAGTYFEGTVSVRTGPYISQPIPIRINFK